MYRIVFAVPALLLAGGVLAQDARDPKAKVPPPQYRSALEDYRPFADPDLREWRKVNDEVGAAGGHAGHAAGQGPAKPAPKPLPREGRK